MSSKQKRLAASLNVAYIASQMDRVRQSEFTYVVLKIEFTYVVLKNCEFTYFVPKTEFT